MMKKELMAALGIGVAVGAGISALVRPRKKNVKNAVAKVVSDVADSISENMIW